jgi:hypothetical protein
MAHSLLLRNDVDAHGQFIIETELNICISNQLIL